MLNKRYLWTLLSVAVLLSMVAAQCAGQQPAPAPATEAPAPATEAPAPATEAAAPTTVEDEWGVVTVKQGDPIKIGFAAGLSGAGIDALGIDEERGAELANAAQSEVKGFKVELQVEDSGCNAEGGQTVATKFVADPQIAAVVGHMCSSSCTPAADIYSQNHYSMVSPSCTAPSLTGPGTGTDIFNRTAWNDTIQGPAAAQFVYNDLGVSKVATIHDGSPYAEQLGAEFSKAFEALGGQIVAAEAVNVGDTDMRPVLTRIKANEPELIYFSAFPAEGAFIRTQMADVGMEDVLMMGADGIRAQSFIDGAGEAAEGVYASAADIAEAGPGLQDFLVKYKDTYGEDPIAPFHAHAYDAYMMILDAIDRAAVVDQDGNLLIGRKALRDAIRSTTDFQGLTGTLTCSENGDCGRGVVAVSVVQNGEWVPVEAPAEAAMAEVGLIKVGNNAEYPPFESVDDSGNIVGFDIDLMNAIASEAGFEVEYVNTRWDGIFVALASGEFDAVISAATITPERAETVDFSDPYFDAGQAITVRADNTDITGPDDLAGKSVGVQLGTTGDIWLTENTQAEVVRYDENTLAFQALATGDVDAAVADSPTAADIVKANPEMNLKLLPGVYTEEQYGIAVSKDRPEVLAAINQGLAAVKASGEYDTIYQKWFGAPEAAAPPEEAPALGEETLVFAQSADAGTLDPALETSANSLAPATHIYEGLTDFEPGSTTPVPKLATSWEASDDGLEWTFHLREGVTFHDGTPFNADAVVFNFERWWDTDSPYNLGADQFIYWDYMFQGFKGDENSVLAGIEKIDDMTVKLTLNRPNASLLNTLAMENFRFASPAAVEEQGENYGTAEGRAVGTGPFMVEDWVKEDHLTLLRNDNYWGEKPTLQRIEYRVIPDTSAAFLALQAGDIDMLSLWASPGPDDIEAAKQDPNLQVVYNPAFNVGYLGLNLAKPWLQNMNARLAIAHAIDKQAIIDSLYPGDAEPAKEFQPPSLWGYNDQIEDYPYDPALAQEYLQKAIDEGVEIPDPVIFYVMPVSRAYYPQPQPTGELIQAYLAEIGINAEIQSPAWPDPYLSDLEEDGTKHDLFMLGWVGDNGDPDNFLCVFFCGGDTSFNNDGQGGGLPPDEEIATLLRDAVAETDFDARQADYQEANLLLHDRVISVPIVHRTPPTLMRSNIKGYIPSPVREVLTYITKE
jgi:ABC-type transport system substrate-binding protein/ABC-type branched-subunit amino acid transport system substrate-binding protein